MNKVLYKIFLEATAIVAVIAGASFCAELLLPGIISLSQKTLTLLSLFTLMVLVARYLSLVHRPNTPPASNSQIRTFLMVGLFAIPPLYIATKNFSPVIQIILIVLTLTIGYLLLTPDKK